MMDRLSHQLNLGRKLLLAGVGVTTLAIVALLNAPFSSAQLQPAAPQSFEVASIKRNAQGFIDIGGGARILSGATRCHGVDTLAIPGDPLPLPGLGRCSVRNSTLKELIDVAYRLRLGPPRSKVDLFIFGGPGWASTTVFDIEAKAEDPATTSGEGLFLMFQQLLAERFKLKFHREVREISGFVLVIAKDGPKLKLAAENELPQLNMKSGLVSGQKVPIGSIANFLTQRFGRMVTDKTGMTGVYDFTLTWTPDESELSPTGLPVPTVSGDQPGPSLTTALQEQLGLRLETQKTPMDVIVVDSAEMPDPN
jgi:uncharacterized protein (TIGR03435 family)